MPKKQDDKEEQHDSRFCPAYSGEDPGEFVEYRHVLSWWLLTQSAQDKDSGATAGRIVSSLTGNARKIIFETIVPEDIDDYKKDDGISCATLLECVPNLV